MSDDILGVTIHGEQCNLCDLHDRLEREYPVSDARVQEMVHRIKRRGRRYKYDCLVGISGGSDSSYLLYWAYINDLRVLAFHFDNGFNHDFAERNMTRLVEATGVDLIRIRINVHEYNDINIAFLNASVSDCDIPNDIAMSSLMLDLAVRYDVKTILNGHNFRTEGSCPVGWTYMDGRYIEDVYAQTMFSMLNSYPQLTIRQQVKASLKGVHQERPFYHMACTKEENRRLLQQEFGWESYTGWHCENAYTQFAGWVIYRKFGIDKRRVELSAKIRSGVINRKTAQLILEDPIQEPVEVVDRILAKLNLRQVDFVQMLQKPRRLFTDFNTYHGQFVRYRWLIWLGYKLGFLPKTFYAKYTRRLTTNQQ